MADFSLDAEAGADTISNVNTGIGDVTRIGDNVPKVIVISVRTASPPGTISRCDFSKPKIFEIVIHVAFTCTIIESSTCHC